MTMGYVCFMSNKRVVLCCI